MSNNFKFDHARIVKAINNGMAKAHDSVKIAVSAIVLLQIENNGDMSAKAMRAEVNGAADTAGWEAFRKLYARANEVYRDHGEVLLNRIGGMNVEKTFDNVMGLVHKHIWTQFKSVDDIRAFYAKERATPDDDAVQAKLFKAVNAALGNLADTMTLEQYNAIETRMAVIHARITTPVADTLAEIGLDVSEVVDDTANTADTAVAA